MPERAYLSIGSNIEPEANVRRALEMLSLSVRVIALSTVYETEPLGCASAPRFFNCVAAVETDLSPVELKEKVLKPIEDALGRVRGMDKDSDRTIDLDLILYGSLTEDSPGLKLPSPEVETRPFVAWPLNEIAPGLKLPSGRPLYEAIGSLPRDGMRPLKAYTELLRASI